MYQRSVTPSFNNQLGLQVQRPSGGSNVSIQSSPLMQQQRRQSNDNINWNQLGKQLGQIKNDITGALGSGSGGTTTFTPTGQLATQMGQGAAQAGGYGVPMDGFGWAQSLMGSGAGTGTGAAGTGPVVPTGQLAGMVGQNTASTAPIDIFKGLYTGGGY